jgi:hypothetical protein
MRQAFTWAAVASIFWLLLPAGTGWMRDLAGLVSAVASAVWIVHLLAYGLRRMREAALLARYRNLHDGHDLAVALRGARDALVISLPVWIVRNVLGVAQQRPWCNCYFDSDCGFLMFCNWNIQCNNQRKGTSHDGVDCPQNETRGSCDGRCRFLRWKVAWEARAPVADAIDALFGAFADAARAERPYGRPAEAELAAIGAGLTDDCRADLRALVFSALDVVLGWDLIRGAEDPVVAEHGYSDAFIGHVPDVQATPAIVAAARDAFRTALADGDVDAALAPLARFWQRFPAYRPAHSGRCYPHGHARYASALECQQAQFRKMLEALAAAVSAPGRA